MSNLISISDIIASINELDYNCKKYYQVNPMATYKANRKRRIKHDIFNYRSGGVEILNEGGKIDITLRMKELSKDLLSDYEETSGNILIKTKEQ